MLFLEFCKGKRPLAFHLSFWLGVALGSVYQLSNEYPKDWSLRDLYMGDGSYKKLLGVNVLGACACFAAFWLGNLLDSRIWGKEEVFEPAGSQGGKYKQRGLKGAEGR